MALFNQSYMGVCKAWSTADMDKNMHIIYDGSGNNKKLTVFLRSSGKNILCQFKDIPARKKSAASLNSKIVILGIFQ